MMKINAIIPTGETASVGLVRYFEAYGKKYFVYTLNEKDEQGFVKLYVCKVNNGIGEFIDDDGEWKSIKDEFKKIIGENSENNSTTANDLNPRELANINVKGHRVIKLMENYVNSLSANQKEFGQGSEAAAAPAAPVNNFEMPSMPSFDAPAAPANNFEMPSMPSFDAPAAPANNFEIPSMPSFDAPAAPANNFEIPSMPSFDAPAAPANNFEIPSVPSFDAPATPTSGFEMPSVPSFDAPATPTSGFEMPSVPSFDAPASSNNFEQMYNELKEKFDRCNAELERITNENVELRIKLDDIREILNEN